ncbi:hypothetical protein [Nocardiopsis rhodophaea]|uniref:hypothetical protein n=1 Tax=Nocardiopsis rhodophaea TaxID=280238 RepID=UPI003372A425
MPLEFLGKDPDSEDTNSPTVLRDTATGDYILQGWAITDEQTLDAIGDIPPHETVIRFPQRMMRFFPEVRDGGSHV